MNRDPDAPIADFADMIVIGDLVEVGNAILAELGGRVDVRAFMSPTCRSCCPSPRSSPWRCGFLIVLRRAGRIVARVEGFRSVGPGLAARIDQSLDGATGRIDAVRRGQLGADTIGPTIEAATDAVARYADEARALKGPPAGMPSATRSSRARACRARARHGGPRRGSWPRFVGAGGVEAQTSIKRGYLNLVHAREAIVRHAEAARGLGAATGPAGQGSVPARQSRP